MQIGFPSTNRYAENENGPEESSSGPQVRRVVSLASAACLHHLLHHLHHLLATLRLGLRDVLADGSDDLRKLLDALHHAYVEPRHVPPGAFVPAVES